MNEEIHTLLISFAGSAGAVAVVGWLARKGISHALSRDLETKKIQLKAELDVANRHAIAELEGRLRISEAQITKLQERRSEVLIALYQKMVAAFRDAASFLSPLELESSPTKAALREKLVLSLDEFVKYYHDHKIFFSKDVVEKIDELVKSIRNPASRFSRYLSMKEAGDLGATKMFDAWEKSEDAFEKLAVPAKDAVEEEFRTLLGVHNSRS